MNTQGMNSLAKATFASAGTPLAFQFRAPPDAQQYSAAFTAKEKAAVPAPGLFRALTSNDYHVETAKKIGRLFEKYIEGIDAAIGSAIDRWAKLAVITNAPVNAVAGVVTPGGLKGPPLHPLIMAQAPMRTPAEQRYSNAIARAFADAFDAWAKGYTGPLFFPPTFAACPSPLHPPTPNLPAPLVVGSSPGDALLTRAALSGAMIAQLNDPRAYHQQTLFDALAASYGTVFLVWKTQTMLTNVLGTGPVPSFAPPVAPVGPVVGGQANGPPGCLVSPPSAAAWTPAGDGSPEAQQRAAEAAAKQAQAQARELAKTLEKAGSELTRQATNPAAAPPAAAPPPATKVKTAKDFERKGERQDPLGRARGDAQAVARSSGQLEQRWWAPELELFKGDAKTEWRKENLDFWGGKESAHVLFGLAEGEAKASASDQGVAGSVKGGLRGSLVHFEGQHQVANAKIKNEVDVATAKAEVNVSLAATRQAVGAHVKGELGANVVEAKVEAAPKFKLPGTDVSVELVGSLSGSVGANAGGEATAGYFEGEDGRKKAGVSLAGKAALGLGGGVKLGINVQW